MARPRKLTESFYQEDFKHLAQSESNGKTKIRFMALNNIQKGQTYASTADTFLITIDSVNNKCFNNVIPIPLPPYLPELNPVEQLWLNIKQRYLSNRSFEGYDEIVDECCSAWHDILKEKEFVRKSCIIEWALLV